MICAQLDPSKDWDKKIASMLDFLLKKFPQKFTAKIINSPHYLKFKQVVYESVEISPDALRPELERSDLSVEVDLYLMRGGEKIANHPINIFHYVREKGREPRLESFFDLQSFYELIEKLPNGCEKVWLETLPFYSTLELVDTNQIIPHNILTVSLPSSSRANKAPIPQEAKQNLTAYLQYSLSHYPGIIFSQEHGDQDSYAELIKSFPELKNRGVDYLYLELKQFSKHVLTKFNETGDEELLQQHFEWQGKKAFNFDSSRNYLNLIIAARRANIKTLPIDIQMSSGISESIGSDLKRERTRKKVEFRDAYMAANICNYQRQYPGKFIALVGMAHHAVARKLQLPYCSFLPKYYVEHLQTAHILPKFTSANNILPREYHGVLIFNLCQFLILIKDKHLLFYDQKSMEDLLATVDIIFLTGNAAAKLTPVEQAYSDAFRDYSPRGLKLDDILNKSYYFKSCLYVTGAIGAASAAMLAAYYMHIFK